MTVYTILSILQQSEYSKNEYSKIFPNKIQMLPLHPNDSVTEACLTYKLHLLTIHCGLYLLHICRLGVVFVGRDSSLITDAMQSLSTYYIRYFTFSRHVSKVRRGKSCLRINFYWTVHPLDSTVTFQTCVILIV